MNYNEESAIEKVPKDENCIISDYGIDLRKSSLIANEFLFRAIVEFGVIP